MSSQVVLGGNLSLSLSHGAPPEGHGGSGRGRSWLRPELPTAPAQASPASSTKWAPTAAAPLSAWAESDEALEAMATARRRTTATRAAGGWRPGLMKWWLLTPHAGHLHPSQSGGGGARFGANKSKSEGSKQVDSVPVNLNAAATPRWQAQAAMATRQWRKGRNREARTWERERGWSISNASPIWY